MTQDEMVRCHHRLDGHEYEQAPGDGNGQGSLACYSPWGNKESDMTEWLNWIEHIYIYKQNIFKISLKLFFKYIILSHNCPNFRIFLLLLLLFFSPPFPPFLPHLLSSSSIFLFFLLSSLLPFSEHSSFLPLLYHQPSKPFSPPPASHFFFNIHMYVFIVLKIKKKFCIWMK